MSGPESSGPFTTEAEIRAHLTRSGLSEEEQSYVDLMLPRYVRVIEIVGELLSRCAGDRSEKELSILDVAPHLLTDLLVDAFAARVNTIGVPYGTDTDARIHDHLNLDLNDLHDRDSWPGFWKHDVVFMGEIIEHLWASPRMVLGAAARWVADDGFLVVQTPNAVALDRRLTLLRGRNPYEMLREGNNPGHIREYTADELVPLAESVGLDVEQVRYENYFRNPDRGLFKRTWYGAITGCWRTLRDGMTLVFRKRRGVSDPVLRSRVAQGVLDHLHVENDRVIAVGWSVDTRARRPVDRLEVLAGDQVLHRCSPDLDREDVAHSLGDPAFTRCGFRVEVPCPGMDPSGLRLRAYDAFGDALELQSG